MGRHPKNKGSQLPDSDNGSQFFKNIYYFYVNSGMDKGEFLRKSGINSINMWRRYAGGTTPRSSTLNSFTLALNEIIASRPSLKILLPDGITDPMLLLNSDLAGLLSEGKPPAQISESTFTPVACISKFTGIYIVYYPNTSESDNADYKLSYGVMAVTEDAIKNDFRLTCRAFFNINANRRKKHCFAQMNSVQPDKLPATILQLKAGPLTAERYYEGELTLAKTFFWLNMRAMNHTEFLSVSFDMDVKTLYLNPDKLFDGTRGIALSQAADASDLHSIAFPLILSKRPIEDNVYQVRNFLNFRYNAPDETLIARVSEKIITSLETLDALPEGSLHLKKIYLNDLLKNMINEQIGYVLTRTTVLDKISTGNCYEQLLKRR